MPDNAKQQWERIKAIEHDARTLAILTLPPVVGWPWSHLPTENSGGYGHAYLSGKPSKE
jgi:hypothetical protein